MATEGDRERGVRRVKPDAGELEQTPGRARAPTVRHDGPREVMQCLGPTNEAERADDASNRRNAGSRERFLIRPAAEELLVDGCDGLPPGALKEDLGDQDSEGVPLAPPREITPVRPPPLQEVSDESIPIPRLPHVRKIRAPL